MNFEELYSVWSRNMDRRGMGALVFMYGDSGTPENGVDFAYLTLGELRDFLSRYTDNQGFVYRWVKQAETAQGIPVLILPHVGSGDPAPALSSVMRG